MSAKPPQEARSVEEREVPAPKYDKWGGDLKSGKCPHVCLGLAGLACYCGKSCCRARLPGHGLCFCEDHVPLRMQANLSGSTGAAEHSPAHRKSKRQTRYVLEEDAPKMYKTRMWAWASQSSARKTMLQATASFSHNMCLNRTPPPMHVMIDDAVNQNRDVRKCVPNFMR